MKTQTKLSLNIRPLANRILVEPIEEQQQTVSGLYIPETAKEKPQQGRVLAVGPGAYRDKSLERIPLDVQEGDRVLFARYAGSDIQLNNQDLKIMKESDVLAIVEDDDSR
jgi:chaperonin GroES